MPKWYLTLCSYVYAVKVVWGFTFVVKPVSEASLFVTMSVDGLIFMCLIFMWLQLCVVLFLFRHIAVWCWSHLCILFAVLSFSGLLSVPVYMGFLFCITFLCGLPFILSYLYIQVSSHTLKQSCFYIVTPVCGFIFHGHSRMWSYIDMLIPVCHLTLMWS